MTPLFWQVIDAVCNIWKSKGKVPGTAKNEFIEILKQLVGALGEKDFFGGDSFGFVDVIAIPLTCWFYAVEEFGDLRLRMSACKEKLLRGSFQTQKRSANLLSC